MQRVKLLGAVEIDEGVVAKRQDRRDVVARLTFRALHDASCPMAQGNSQVMAGVGRRIEEEETILRVELVQGMFPASRSGRRYVRHLHWGVPASAGNDCAPV